MDEALALCSGPAGMTATALEPTLVLRLNHDDVETILRHDTVVRRLLAWRLLERLAAEGDGQPLAAAVHRRTKRPYQIFGPLGDHQDRDGAPGVPRAFFLARNLAEGGRLCVLYDRAGAWHEITAWRPATLLDLMETYGNVPEAVAVAWLAELCVALDYWHRRGIVYTRSQDLTPGTIYLDEEGHVSVTAASSPTTRGAGPAGGRGSLPVPSRTAARGPVGPAADVSALARLTADLVGWQAHEDATAPISAPLRDLLLWATNPQAAARPSTLAEFARAVAKLPLMARWERARKRPASDSGLQVAIIRPRTGGGSGRLRLALATLAVVLVLLGVAIQGFLWLEGGHSGSRTAAPAARGTSVAVQALHVHPQRTGPARLAIQRAMPPAAYTGRTRAGAPSPLRQVTGRLYALAAGCRGPASLAVVRGTGRLLASGLSDAAALRVAGSIQRPAALMEGQCPAAAGQSHILALRLHRLQQQRVAAVARAEARRRGQVARQRAAAALQTEARRLRAQLDQPGLCRTMDRALAAATTERVIREATASTQAGYMDMGAVVLLVQQVSSLSPCGGSAAAQAAGMQQLGRAVDMLVRVARLSRALDTSLRQGGSAAPTATPALPLDAGGIAPRHAPQRAAPPAAVPDGRYVVVPGDSLWSIAQQHYHNGFAWVFIWAANKYHTVAPGQTLSSPDIVVPGWRLTVSRRLP
ncbi:MAG: hypothetical protein NVSMB65_03240 [Chloroflexota bacterium]